MILKLIRPKVKRKIHLLDHYYWFPNNQIRYIAPSLALAILASSTPKDVHVSIIDENIEKIDFNAPVDLVGITITCFTAERGYEIADAFRKMGVKVVLGGIQVTLTPEKSLKHADSVVIGEGENIWPKVLSDFKENKLKNVYHDKKGPSLTGIIPRWDLIDNRKYLLAPIMVTRGCPYSCEYCVIGEHFGHKIRKRSINDVIKEIKYLKKFYEHFWFVDYNLFFDKNYAKDFLKRLIPLNINYTCFANIDISEDEELLGLLSKSGCTSVAIGFETLNPKNLKAVNKADVNKTEKYSQVIKSIQNHGILVRGLFMVGMEYDNKDVFSKVVSFVKENNIVMSDIATIMAYEGTKFYAKLIKKGKLRYGCSKTSFCGRFVDNKIGWPDTAIGQINLYKRLYSYNRVFDSIKRFYETNSQMSKEGFLNKVLYKLKLSDQFEKFYFAYSYLIRGDLARTGFALKLLWHPKSIYRGQRFRDLPKVISFLEWGRIYSMRHYPLLFRKALGKNHNFTSKIRFIFNILRHDYETRIKRQGIDLAVFISMQEWGHRLNPSLFFNACANSRIRNRFLFLLNMLILGLEFKNYKKQYDRLQNKAYKQLIS